VQGTLYSAYSLETTETAGVTTPPNPATNLAPANDTIINPTQIRNFTWQYNSSDTSAQTQFQIAWRVKGGSFTFVAPVTSPNAVWAAPANTFPDNSTIEWEVNTRGANAAWGNYSAIAEFKTVGDPNALREQKRVMRMNLETGKPETATVGVLPPIGSMVMFGGAAAPSGWMLCQGQSLLRADYLDLFGVIGTVYGAVDSTHFSLPNLQDTFPQGAGPVNVLGATGGQAKMPKHWHSAATGPNGSDGTLVTVSAGGHFHNYTRRATTGPGTGAAQGGGAAQADDNTGTSGSGHDHTIGGHTATEGSGPLPDDNRPPFVTVNYLIKV
jgi:microcystin-dependent protein